MYIISKKPTNSQEKEETFEPPTLGLLAAHRPTIPQLHIQKPTFSIHHPQTFALDPSRLPVSIASVLRRNPPRRSTRFAQTRCFERMNECSTTIYVSNFPDDWASNDVKGILGKAGLVRDAFMPEKRNKDGKKFVFARGSKYKRKRTSSSSREMFSIKTSENHNSFWKQYKSF